MHYDEPNTVMMQQFTGQKATIHQVTIMLAHF